MGLMRSTLQTAFISQLQLRARKYFSDTQYRRVQVACRLILRLDAGNQEAYFWLGQSYFMTGCYQPALDAFRQLANLAPDHVGAYIHMALCHLEELQFEEAYECAHRALEIGPGLPSAYLVLGSVHEVASRFDEAAECWERSLELDPHCVDACLNLGMMEVDRDRKDKANDWFERAAQIAPHSIKAYSLWISSGCFTTDATDLLARVKSVLDSGQLNVRERSIGHFALGTICDRMGNYEEAFEHFEAGNSLMRPAESRRVVRNKLKRVYRSKCRVFEAEQIARVQALINATNTDKLVFIVGMPRSGTTLVEQILASHPEVSAGGERPDIRKLADRLPAEIGSGERYPECLVGLDAAVANRLVEEHMDRVFKLAPEARLFTDKLPDNFNELGLIRMLFPMAKIIHCKRDPLDITISCFAQNFAFLPYTASLDHIAEYIHYHDQLMQYWKSLFGPSILEVAYEDLVSSPEDVIRSLLSYCQLSWSPKCLTFHKTTRPAKTASRCQVKRPIYASSVGRWKNYEKHLEGVVKRLSHRTAIH